MKSMVFFPWDNDKDPGYTIKSLSYTCQDWKHWKRLSSFRFCWGFLEVLLRMLRFQRLAQSELSQSEQPSCHGTTMDPQDRKNHDFNFQGNTSLFHVVSCNVQALLAFFPGADVSGIWSPRFHMVSYGFMAVTTCDQPVTSWGSQQRRTTSVCNAAEPWRVDGCKLFIYWNEWRRCHLSISTWAISIHFQFIQIPDLNFPEVSQSKCYYLDFSQDYWRVHIDSIEHIWTLLNMIELLVCTCQGRVQADVVSFNTALTACEGGEEFGMAIDFEKVDHVDTVLHMWSHVVMLHWENMNILKTKVFFEHFKWCKAIGSTPSKC